MGFVGNVGGTPDMDFIYKKCIELDIEQLINEFIDQSKEIKKVAENENN